MSELMRGKGQFYKNKDNGMKTYVIEVAMDDYNFFREIDQDILDIVMNQDDGKFVRDIIIDEGMPFIIENTDQIDLYLGYASDWEEMVKNEWKEYLDYV